MPSSSADPTEVFSARQLHRPHAHSRNLPDILEDEADEPPAGTVVRFNTEPTLLQGPVPVARKLSRDSGMTNSGGRKIHKQNYGIFEHSSQSKSFIDTIFMSLST